jgi:hypothetical protein
MKDESKGEGKAFTRKAFQQEVVDRIYLLGQFIAMFLEPAAAVSLFADPEYESLVHEAHTLAWFHDFEVDGPSQPERFAIWHEAGLVYDFAFHNTWDLHGSYRHPFDRMFDCFMRLKTFYDTTTACVTYQEHAAYLAKLTVTKQVIERALARLQWVKFLAFGEPDAMTIRDFALVADLSDRTIRNILSLDDNAEPDERSGLMVRKDGSKVLIDLQASATWIRGRKEFQITVYDSLYDNLPILRGILEAERTAENLDIEAFAQKHGLPEPALRALIEENIRPNPILLDCAEAIAQKAIDDDDQLNQDPAYQARFRNALTEILLRDPMPFCCYAPHEERDQWEETGELIETLSGFFKDRKNLLENEPKLRWLLNVSYYLR